MGLFDRKKPEAGSKDEARERKAQTEDRPAASPAAPKADFSNVQSGASSTAPAPAQQGTTYTVESGDTLWAIAQRHYGDGNQWGRIHRANMALIPDPDLIQPGQVLTIPAADTAEEGR